MGWPTTLLFLEGVFGANSWHCGSSRSLIWYFSGQRISGGWEVNKIIEQGNHEAYLGQLGSAKGFLLAAYDCLKQNDIEDVFKPAINKRVAQELMKVLSLLRINYERLSVLSKKKRFKIVWKFINRC